MMPFSLPKTLGNSLMLVGNPAKNRKMWDLATLEAAIPVSRGSKAESNCRDVVRRFLRDHVKEDGDDGSMHLVHAPYVTGCYKQDFAFRIDGLYLSTADNVRERMKRSSRVRIFFALYNNSKDLNGRSLATTSTFVHENDCNLRIPWTSREPVYDFEGPLNDMFNCVGNATKRAMMKNPGDAEEALLHRSWMQDVKCCIMLGDKNDPMNPFAAIVVDVVPRIWKCRLNTKFLLHLADATEFQFMTKLLVVKDSGHWMHLNDSRNGADYGQLVASLPDNQVDRVCKNLLRMAFRAEDETMRFHAQEDAMYAEIYIKPIASISTVHYSTIPDALRNGTYPRACKRYVEAIFESRLGKALPNEIIIFQILERYGVLQPFMLKMGTGRVAGYIW
jgi:hypothetical protein